jgi:hypothetical protein
MKKFLYIAAMTLLLASCTEDFKDWAEPQSTPQGEVITFGGGSITPVGVIDFAEVPADAEWVKVCDIAPVSSNDTAYVPVYTIILNGQEFPLNSDGTMNAADLQSYVISLYGKAPEPRVLSAQVKCVMSNGVTATTIMSDPFEITVTPAPIAVPDLWYLVGSCIGDGSWGNDPANVGIALIPMYTEAEDFSVLTYAGYFPAGQGFKLIHKPGNWDEQWGMKDGAYVKNDGGSGNIEVAADGYYMVTYDMNAETLTVEPYADIVSVYSKITMPGAYQDWNVSGNQMNPMSSVVENHDWVMDMDFEENTELKFANGTWAVNWGAETFPVGSGVQNGANIPVDAGSYKIVFNDILGKYYFIAR